MLKKRKKRGKKKPRSTRRPNLYTELEVEVSFLIWGIFSMRDEHGAGTFLSLFLFLTRTGMSLLRYFLGTNTVTVLSNRGRGDFSADLSMFPLAHLLTSLLGSEKSTWIPSLHISCEDESFLTKTSSQVESYLCSWFIGFCPVALLSRHQLQLMAALLFRVLLFNKFSFVLWEAIHLLFLS